MLGSKLVEYKFISVYEFVNIIYKSVEAGTDFWDFDSERFVQSALKFNENTLLHIYVTSTLYNHYSKKYYEEGDIYEDEEIKMWIELMTEYGILSKDEEYHPLQDSTIYDWFQAKKVLLKKLFEIISEEVVHVLFNNKQFLAKFNTLVRNVIRDEDDTYKNIMKWPENSKNVDGTLKRHEIPIWVKRAVYHRDKGHCVFCNCDLTWIVNILRQKNFDHIVPLKDYGTNDPCNIQLTCESCNKSKGAHDKVAKYKYQSWW